ncbi:unnamed protein product, partial [Phaeothamnion confervicola]
RAGVAAPPKHHHRARRGGREGKSPPDGDGDILHNDVKSHNLLTRSSKQRYVL